MADTPTFYEIRVEGRLEDCWADWFDGLAIAHSAGPSQREGEGEETVLSGVLTDQAALHGVLLKIRDLNLALVSISRRTGMPEP